MTSSRVAGAAVAAVLVTGSASIAAPPKASHTVLTIYQGAESFPANPVYDVAIRQGLQANVREPIDYFAEYLDPGPAAAADEDEALAQYIHQKYRARRIDVVMTVADEALRFALAHRDDLFPGAPIVFMAPYAPDEGVRTAGAGVTGVKVGIAYTATMRAALALHPDTERVFVVANGNPSVTTDVIRAELRESSSHVTLTYLDAPTVARLLDSIRAIPSRSLVLYIGHPPDSPGNLLYPDAIARLVAQASPVPVYGTSDFYVGTGVVGGVMRHTRETARRMGELAAAILNGARAQDLPVETSRVIPTFDWTQIRRWGIDPATLPAGSDLQFKSPTIWESYRGYIVGAILVIVGQLTLIAGLVTQRARLRRAESIVRAREATLRKSYERSRHLAGRLLNAQEATRASIARDLHDGLCQDLASVTAALNELKDASGAIEDPGNQQVLTEIEEETLGVYDQIRRLSHDLHPPTLRILGLASALKAHCAEVERRHGVDIKFAVGDNVGHLDPDIEISLFRIAQEALRNGIVHGHALHLSVELARRAASVELTVIDDGSGFDVDAARRSGRGLGLMSMDERAHVFGGDLSVVSASEHGTTVRVTGFVDPSVSV